MAELRGQPLEIPPAAPLRLDAAPTSRAGVSVLPLAPCFVLRLLQAIQASRPCSPSAAFTP